MRRIARECVFKLVFEYTFYEQSNDVTLEMMSMASDLDEDDKAYIADTYKGVVDNYEHLKAVVSKHLKNYTIDRLYRPDLAALLLAAYELESKRIPVAVVIDEAVELAKKYGTEKSGGFVNGVLKNVALELK